MHFFLPVASILPATVKLRNSRCHGRSAAPGKCCTWVEHPSQIPSERARHKQTEKQEEKQGRKKEKQTLKTVFLGAGGDLGKKPGRPSKQRRLSHWAEQCCAVKSLSALCQTSLIQTSLPACSCKLRLHSRDVGTVFFPTTPPIASWDPARAHMISL